MSCVHYEMDVSMFIDTIAAADVGPAGSGSKKRSAPDLTQSEIESIRSGVIWSKKLARRQGTDSVIPLCGSSNGNQVADDPFATIRGPWDLAWPQLQHYYMMRGPPDYSGRVYQESYLLRDLWWPLCGQEPALMSTTVLISQALRPDAHLFQNRLSSFKMHCLKLNNEALNDASRRQHDAMLASIVSVLVYECLFGTPAERLPHVKGLQQLVTYRGGIMAQGISWIIRRTVIWILRVHEHLLDLGTERPHDVGKQASYEWTPDPWAPQRGIGRSLDPAHPAREALTFYDERISSGNPYHRLIVGALFPGQDVLDCLEELGLCLHPINNEPEAAQESDLRHKLKLIELRLLGLAWYTETCVVPRAEDFMPYRRFLAYEGLRRCALLIVSLMNEKNAQVSISTQTDHCAQLLALLELERLKPTDPIILLWITVTAITITKAPLNQRFEALAAFACRNMALTTVDLLRSTVSRILYCARVHDHGLSAVIQHQKGLLAKQSDI